jgi:hypothetical protein
MVLSLTWGCGTVFFELFQIQLREKDSEPAARHPAGMA